jgi:hypothetical protein
MEKLTTKQLLIYYLKNQLENTDEILAIVLLMKSQAQQETMITFLHDRQNQKLTENYIIAVAKKISEQVK